MREEFRKTEKQKNNQASDKKQKNSSFWDEQYIKKAEEKDPELFADGDTDAFSRKISRPLFPKVVQLVFSTEGRTAPFALRRAVFQRASKIHHLIL